MRSLILLSSLTVVSGVHGEESAEFSLVTPRASSICRQISKAAAQQAVALLASEQNSCLGFIKRIDELAIDYWQKLASEDVPHFYASCQKLGFQKGLNATRENTLDNCSEELSAASKVSYDLGYAACFLDSEVYLQRGWQLVYQVVEPTNDFSIFDYVVSPRINSSWLDQLAAKATPGLKFGCLLGQRDRISEISPHFLTGLNTETERAYAFGEHLSSLPHFQACFDFELSLKESLAFLDESTFIDFKRGLTSTASVPCLANH